MHLDRIGGCEERFCYERGMVDKGVEQGVCAKESQPFGAGLR